LGQAYAELEKKLANVNQELRQSLQEKEQLHNHLVCILKSMTASVVTVDFQGYNTLFNQTAKNLMGAKAKNVIGRFYEEIYPNRPFLVNTL
jgi:nitrogen fixation/metabolism regulation signal transduction histidine kinase